MLVLGPATGRYDPDATPSTDPDTLFDFYARVIGIRQALIAATTPYSEQTAIP